MTKSLRHIFGNRDSWLMSLPSRQWHKGSNGLWSSSPREESDYEDAWPEKQA